MNLEIKYGSLKKDSAKSIDRLRKNSTTLASSSSVNHPQSLSLARRFDSYIPIQPSFVHVLKKFNKTEGRQEDAHEFLTHCLTNLHEELAELMILTNDNKMKKKKKRKTKVVG